MLGKHCAVRQSEASDETNLLERSTETFNEPSEGIEMTQDSYSIDSACNALDLS